MWMCVGMPHPQCRIAMNSTCYYTADNLFAQCKRVRWPTNGVFFEYSPNLYLRVSNDTEMLFACEVVSRYHAECCSLDVHRVGGSENRRSTKDAPSPSPPSPSPGKESIFESIVQQCSTIMMPSRTEVGSEDTCSLSKNKPTDFSDAV